MSESTAPLDAADGGSNPLPAYGLPQAPREISRDTPWDTPWETDVRDWIALLKPRVMSLVVFTGLIGLLVAPGQLNPVLAFTAVCASPSRPERAARSTCGTTATSTR